MKRYRILIAVVAGAVLLFGSNGVAAAQDDQAKPSENVVQPSEIPEEKEIIKGYPIRSRRIGTPMDVEWSLNDSFPKSGSVLELFLQYLKNRQR